jgi:hypothetical protein
MSFNNTKRYDPPKRKRILIGETLEEETATETMAVEVRAEDMTDDELATIAAQGRREGPKTNGGPVAPRTLLESGSKH